MANNFAGDSACKALWNFESGALTVDSKSTNTLEDINTVQESTDFKQGSKAALFALANAEYFRIADAALSAGYPLKTGDVIKIFSIAGWFKLNTAPGATAQAIYAKNDGPNNKRSLQLYFSDAVNKYFKVLFGYNGGLSSEIVNVASGIQSARWYHFGLTYQDSTKAWLLRLWDDTAQSADTTSGTLGSLDTINAEDAYVAIGCNLGGTPTNYFDGIVDELVIFNDILSIAEIDAIRQGTYPPPSGPAALTAVHTRIM